MKGLIANRNMYQKEIGARPETTNRRVQVRNTKLKIDFVSIFTVKNIRDFGHVGIGFFALLDQCETTKCSVIPSAESFYGDEVCEQCQFPFIYKGIQYENCTNVDQDSYYNGILTFLFLQSKK